MRVKIKLKASKNATELHDVVECYKHENNIVIVCAGMCTLIYSMELVEVFETL